MAGPTIDGAQIAGIAAVAHEANRAFCASIGDFSHKSWEDSPLELRASVINGVAKVALGIVTEPGFSHENWLSFKRAAGWTYGPVKDFEAKTHPCLVPYDQLPEHDRMKDHLFLAIVKTLLLKV